MAFESFISYGHLDNHFPDKWIVNFHKSLETTLSAISGIKTKVFFDLRDNDGLMISEKIKSSLTLSETMIIVLSPSYLNSSWCKLEREFFLKRQKESPGHFAVVEKMPVENDQVEFLHPDVRRFGLYDGDGMPLEKHHKAYRTTIFKLAKSIDEIIKRKKQQHPYEIIKIASNSTSVNNCLFEIEQDIVLDHIRFQRFLINERSIEIDKKLYIILFEESNQEEYLQYLLGFDTFLNTVKEVTGVECLIWMNPIMARDNVKLEEIKNILRKYEGWVKYDFVLNSFEEFKITMIENARRFYH